MTDAATLRTLQRFQQQFACNHDKRTGGNDYILCLDCDFSWDYRRMPEPDPHLRVLAGEWLRVNLPALLAQLDEIDRLRAALDKVIRLVREGYGGHILNDALARAQALLEGK
jgi:hypothetical protein